VNGGSPSFGQNAFGGVYYGIGAHAHAGNAYTAYSPNDPPGYKVVLGKIDSPITILPMHSLIVTSAAPTITPLTLLSGVGGVSL